MDKQAAVNYLYEKGRAIDQRVYELHFGSGSITTVLAALAPYQNDDGGFAHAIEPDLRTPASSAIATSTAFGILRASRAPASSSIVQRAVAYYLDSFDAEKKVWPIIPPEADDAPRAFWWDYEKSAESFGHFIHNPRAAILGHLYAYAELVSAEFLAELTELQLTALEATPNDQLDMFNLDCYVGLAAAPIPDAARKRLNAVIEPAIRQHVRFDAAAELTEMSLTPLRIAPSPTAAFAHLFDAATLEANLDKEMADQLADGSWELGWDWSAVDADAWEMAKREWKGHVIVHKLKLFHAFGRI